MTEAAARHARMPKAAKGIGRKGKEMRLKPGCAFCTRTNKRHFAVNIEKKMYGRKFENLKTPW